jgi:hypothetical protein
MAFRIARVTARVAAVATALARAPVASAAATAAAPPRRAAVAARAFAAAAAAGDAFIVLDETKTSVNDIVKGNPKVVAYYTAS